MADESPSNLIHRGTLMMRTPSVAARLLVVSLVLGAAVSTSTSAFALPHFGVHQHPADTADDRIEMDVYNKSTSFRDVKIGDHVYTLLPHATLTIKAPEGTGI